MISNMSRTATRVGEGYSRAIISIEALVYSEASH
jgi:hypothetical protein